MRKFKKLNMYFFGEESISISDALWFYGVLFGAIVWMVILAGITS